MKSAKVLQLAMASALGFSLVLTGCSSTTTKEASSTSDSKKVTLEFWNGFTGPDGNDMKKIVDGFNKQYEGKIEIKTQTMKWDQFYDKIRTVVNSGTAPDVAAMHLDQVPRMASKGVLTPLDDLLKDSDLKKEDFIPQVWDAGIYESKRYSVPLDVHPIALYYNVDLLKKEGFDKPPATMADFVKIAKATTKDTDGDGKIDQWGFGMPTLWPANLMYYSTLRQFGGESVSKDGMTALYNDDKGVKALQTLSDLIYKDKISPEKIQADGEVTLFKQGKMAMTINGIWMINGFKEQQGLNFAAAAIPQFGDMPATWANSHNFVIPKQKKDDPEKTKAAITFINYVTSNSIEWAKGGQIPAKNSVRDSAEFKALKEQSAIAEQVPYLVFPPASPTYVDVWAPAETAINKALLGQMTPQAALDEAKDKGEKAAKAAK
ncbi:ABC transporter substrate-binding protein [Tumebacillus permanentifrigoris]|uniref:Multiple sugar transport system substrate-binding protein n=1 Tax=Tumebacillus permanentifrigoris TaxID=378543 RepID=A0A316D3W4_9BACL|nr:ABC transporter substrate-binding protein [Tumebacillus permanentifrigoris]PWK06590.1 multiple sugar transport system substrate-binding protein [Tumebacillus permanentifrigoris]